MSTCLGPTSRHVRNFALDNLWRERKPSTCVYIRLPGICWNPAGPIVCIWWILGKSLPRLRLRAAFFSLCALCNKEGKCLREKHFVDRACAEINKCKRRILCVLFSFSFFRDLRPRHPIASRLALSRICVHLVMRGGVSWIHWHGDCMGSE